MNKILFLLVILSFLYSKSVIAKNAFDIMNLNYSVNSTKETEVFESLDLVDSIELKKGRVLVLNKVTAHSNEFDLAVKNKKNFGKIEVYLHKCVSVGQKGDFMLLSLNEKSSEQKNLIFRGWLSAKNPSLFALEHPVYQVIAMSCER